MATKKKLTWLELQEQNQAHYEAHGLPEAHAAALAREATLYHLCVAEAHTTLSCNFSKGKIDQVALVALATAIRTSMTRGVK